ncbi:MAG TPA: stage IV sporulation protein A, partial [Bacillota bacterium]|nr:stage IV sporulation protein A [Bacillota bacterium]
DIGTKKVINDHSTIGLVVTCDGTIGEIGRDSYISAERKCIEELKAIKKPFVIILNSADPTSQAAGDLARELESTYNVPVALVNCLLLDEEDIKKILEMILCEFPIRELSFDLPGWLNVLPDDHPLRAGLLASIVDACRSISKIKDVKDAFNSLGSEVKKSEAAIIQLSSGCGEIVISLSDGLFYRILGEMTGLEIVDESDLAEAVFTLSEAKKSYDKVSQALKEVEESGYGIVTPTIDDMTLEEPEIVRQTGGYGVKLKASAPSYHIIKANIETEVSPIVGTAQQSEELVKFLLNEFEEDPKKIWESNMFGKSLYELVGEGLNAKLTHMPEDAQKKLSRALERIINEGTGGMICILL